MQAYSLDLRQRVVAAYENGIETILEVAERFEVSDSFIKKLLRRKRATGTIARVGHRGGQPKRLNEKNRKWLLKTVLAAPDITLEDLREQLLNEQQVTASAATLSRELRGLNLRRKKNRWSLVKEISKSGSWQGRRMKRLQRAERLRFLDEAGATTILTRLYARAVGGSRTTEAVPRNYGASTSMISTLGVAGVEATMTVEGSVDTVCFNAYCEHILRPTLRAGDLDCAG